MLRAVALSSMTNSSALRYERKRPMPASIRQRNDLALQHLGLAGFVASRLQRQGLDDLDDLMQEARIGLLRGAERFNRQLGLKPSTYLTSCARGQVLHYRRDRAAMVRIPWRLRNLYVAGMKLQRAMEQGHQPPLSDGELAHHLNVSVQRWQEACRCHRLMRTGELPDNDTLQGSSQPKDPQRTWLLQALQRLQQNDRELLERHLLEGHSLKRLANDDAMTCRQLGRRIKHLVEELKQWAHQDGLLTLKAV